jgi:hypothetical protein
MKTSLALRSAAGFLALTIGASPPAAACGGWMACIFGSRQPDDPQTQSLQPSALPPPAIVDLAVRPVAHPALSAFGIEEGDIRRAFDLAYGRQQFASGDAREKAFHSWRTTIKRPFEDDDVRIYHPNFFGDHDINAMLDLKSGQLSYEIVSTDKSFQKSLGVALGLERDSGIGLFARAYVALGGRNAVRNLRAKWVVDSSDNLKTYNSQIAMGTDKLTAANRTFTGKMAQRFYGFTAIDVQSDLSGNQTVIFAHPVPDSSRPGGGSSGIHEEATEEKQDLLR